MLKKLRLLKYFVLLLFTFLVVLCFNSYLNKCFNEMNKNNNNNNNKEESITEKKNLRYDDVSFLPHIEFSRDFYRYKCNNRQRIGADQKYLKKIPDKLYRIEGRLYTKNLLYITLA